MITSLVSLCLEYTNKNMTNTQVTTDDIDPMILCE